MRLSHHITSLGKPQAIHYQKITTLQWRLLSPHTITKEAINIPLFVEIFLQLRVIIPHVILKILHISHTPLTTLQWGALMPPYHPRNLVFVVQ